MNDEAPSQPAHVIVVGCEKGGSGKSTTSMHLTVALLRLGFAVGTVDLDGRQWTLTRYLSNRAATMQRDGTRLPMPRHFFLAHSDSQDRGQRGRRIDSGSTRSFLNSGGKPTTS